MLHTACETSHSDASPHLKAATIVRESMLSKKHEFHGPFSPDCQTEDVPETLLSLVNVILKDPKSRDPTSDECSNADMYFHSLP